MVSLEVDPSGRYVAASDLVGGALIWDLAPDATGLKDLTVPLYLDMAKYNADGDLVLSGADGALAIVEGGATEVIIEESGLDPPGLRMVISGDRTVIAVHREAIPLLLDSRTLQPLSHELAPGFLVFGMDSNGERLLVAGGQGTQRAQVRDRQNRQVVLFQEDQNLVVDGAFFGDGTYLAVGDASSGTGVFTIYDTTRQLVPVFSDDTIPASTTTLVEVSSDERHAIVLGTDGVGRAYDLEAAVSGGDAIIGDISLRPGSATGLRFVPDSDNFVIRDQLGTVTVYDFETLQPRYSLPGRYADGSIDISDDGSRLLVTSGRSIREFPIRPDDIVGLAEATFGRLTEDECLVLVSPDGCP